jgi:hypothetical protein
MSTEVRRLELTIGPFRDGTGSWLNENEGSQDVGGALSMLSDEVEVRPVQDGEMLHVVMVDHRPVGRSLSG